MHVSSSGWNTATQTDDKTHTERTAAAACRGYWSCALAYSATRWWPNNETELCIEFIGLSVQWLKRTLQHVMRMRACVCVCVCVTVWSTNRERGRHDRSAGKDESWRYVDDANVHARLRRHR